MTLAEIENAMQSADAKNKITVFKATVTDWNGCEIAKMTIDVSDSDLPVVIRQRDGFIRIANRDIPQFIAALAMMCKEE
jgi:hypothetical protein